MQTAPLLYVLNSILSLFSKIEKMSFAGVLADADVKAALGACTGKGDNKYTHYPRFRLVYSEDFKHIFFIN